MLAVAKSAPPDYHTGQLGYQVPVPKEVETASVLIVDDIAEYRKRLSAVIERMSLIPLTAENGRIAIQVALQKRPDVIILDIHMPEMDGFAAARVLRARPETSRIPIVFLTAEGTDPASMARGIALGAYDYMKKPVLERDLIERVAGALRSRYLGAR